MSTTTTTTNVLITGVTRGIGLSLLKAYLSRANHTVIGTVRSTNSPSTASLTALPTAPNTRLILLGIESTSASNYPAAVATLREQGITQLDLVIANAGICPDPTPLVNLDVKDVSNAFAVKTVGPILLFQAVRELLEKKGPGAKAVHASEQWLTVFALHPGLVQTEMSNKGAQMRGLEEAPNTLEESTSKTMALIDGSTRETTSGRFFNSIDGSEFP